VHPTVRIKFPRSNRNANLFAANERSQYRITPAVSTTLQQLVNVFCTKSVVQEFEYCWFEAVQYAQPMARLSGTVFGLPSPLGDCLLVQAKLPSDLANSPALVMKLVANLEECVPADHIESNLRPFAGRRNGGGACLMEMGVYSLGGFISVGSETAGQTASRANIRSFTFSLCFSTKYYIYAQISVP